MLLKKGDTIAALALSKAITKDERNKGTEQNIKRNFAKIGLNIKIYSSCFEREDFGCPPLPHRIRDFHNAIIDPKIKGIISVRGGRNSNQLLSLLDFKLIKKKPKIIIGYSDITAILNAVYKKTGIKTIHGPMLTNFFKEEIDSYTLKSLEHILFEGGETHIEQNNSTDQPRIIQKGNATGIAIGGNMTTFQHLSGTNFIPELKGKIIYLEDTQDVWMNSRDRAITALSLQKNAEKISGFLIGKGNKEKGLTKKNLEKTFQRIEIFKHIPIIGNLDFGHLNASFSIKIGGKTTIKTKDKEVFILQ